MTPTLLSYSGLSRVSKLFKWILGTSPRMTKESVCAKFLTCIGMTILFCLLSTTAYAECTPAPDCASIGYTETSCETTSLKCPFDTTKLYCLPCDSSFKYDCNASNQIGVGNTCNGKYASCACSGGGEFNNGSCLQSCTVGMIYYSDKSCSSNYNSSKTAIGVVVKDNALVIALNLPEMAWGRLDYDVVELTEITSNSEARADMNGKNNTPIIASAHSSFGNPSSFVAAGYCNEYSTVGTNAGDWYLPAAGEVYNYIYNNYSAVKAGWDILGTNIANNHFWSSSEYDTWNAWYVNSTDGNLSYKDKPMGGSVSCLLDISSI